ncbi:MAG: hypothetical protein DRZ90_14010 [Spirochaetes bacterium]|nr:MAG: hypothetical protein DRZ90_14010 [Spirochaetota bacterium]
MNTLSKRKTTNLIMEIGRNWALVFLIIEIVFFSLSARGFLSLRVFQMVFFFGITVFLLGTAELFVIITGGIDLSVGYVMGFASIISAKMISAFIHAGMAALPALLLGIFLTLVIGLLPGLVNGLLISRLRVPPFIATFSMLGITHGIAELLILDGAAKNMPNISNLIGNGYFLYWAPGPGLSLFVRPEIPRGGFILELIPNIVILAFIVIAILSHVLKRTVFGQHTYAIGGNVDAAIRSGINVGNHTVKIYMLSSFLASLSGVIYVLMYITGKGDAGASSLLDSIAAVVIGGASLYGGKGTVWRTILGALIIAVLETGLRVMGIPTFDKYIIVGVILISAVLIDKIFPDKTYMDTKE